MGTAMTEKKAWLITGAGRAGVNIVSRLAAGHAVVATGRMPGGRTDQFHAGCCFLNFQLLGHLPLVSSVMQLLA
jgi:nucleoside-diphosphate-sugar epimerase